LEFLKALLEIDPVQRLSAAEALAHPFLAQKATEPTPAVNEAESKPLSTRTASSASLPEMKVAHEPTSAEMETIVRQPTLREIQTDDTKRQYPPGERPHMCACPSMRFMPKEQFNATIFPTVHVKNFFDENAEHDPSNLSALATLDQHSTDSGASSDIETPVEDSGPNSRSDSGYEEELATKLGSALAVKNEEDEKVNEVSSS